MEDISVLVLFGILFKVQMNSVSTTKSSVGMAILASFYQLVTGVGIGLFFGMLGWVFRLLNKPLKYLKFAKGAWILIVGLII